MTTPSPRRPHGPRDPADAWATGPAGRFWGLAGAAGLLVIDRRRGVLLQHRVSWSDHGGTWGLPGGARRTGEDAVSAAVREAGEEAGVPGDAVVVTGLHRFDVGYWSYTTVLTEAIREFEPVIGDVESEELAWVALDEVTALPLHPGVERMWPQWRARVERPTTLVVDIANVMGSRPDGWWKDRAGAARRLLAQLAAVAPAGVPGEFFGHDDVWHLWPQVLAVVEGQARVVEEVTDLLAESPWTPEVTVVTSDRGLRSRVEALGARTVGAGTLLRLLPG